MKETKVIHKWHGTEEALIGEHNKKALLVIAEKNALIGTVLPKRISRISLLIVVLSFTSTHVVKGIIITIAYYRAVL